MKKHSAKPASTEEEPEVSHLDRALTDITSTAADRLKKWRKPILGAVGAVFGLAVVYSLVSAFAESREEGLNDRLYLLIGSPAAQKEGYTPDKGEVARLLEDVKGKRVEAYVLKSIGNWYFDQAKSLSEKAKKAAAEAASAAATTSTTPDPKAAKPEPPSVASIDEARDQALKIEEEAVKRFPDDSDLRQWANAVKASIEGERKNNWLPSKWKYAPPPSKANGNAEATVAPSAPAAPVAPAVPSVPAPTPEPEAKK